MIQGTGIHDLVDFFSLETDFSSSTQLLMTVTSDSPMCASTPHFRIELYRWRQSTCLCPSLSKSYDFVIV